MRASELLSSDICERLLKGRDVVAEQTFYKAKRRIVYIDEIRKIPDVEIEVYIMQPSDTLGESNLGKGIPEEPLKVISGRQKK